MKPDEQQLLIRMLRDRPGLGAAPTCTATELAAKLSMNEKRAEYLLGKWTDKGWWDYGVSLRTGWLTEKGLEEARKQA